MATPSETTGNRSWVARALIVLGVLVLLWFVTAALIFSSWSTYHSVSPAEADTVMQLALEEAGGGRPYVTIDQDGAHVHRELERATPTELATLMLLVSDPDDGDLVRMDFPFWFVRFKSSDRLNLGTLISALSSDWQDFELSITEEDLARRGPGLILDHTSASGERVVMWSVGAVPD